MVSGSYCTCLFVSGVSGNILAFVAVRWNEFCEHAQFIQDCSVGLKTIQKLCICLLLNPFKFVGRGVADSFM